MIFVILILVFQLSLNFSGSTESIIVESRDNVNSSLSRNLLDRCSDVTEFKQYFKAIDAIYRGEDRQIGTCLPLHKKCGWPSIQTSSELTNAQKKLPLLVVSVGLEGAGHHLWTEILGTPVFDCLWINARHYKRDIGDGVPRTVNKLSEGFKEMFDMRLSNGKQPCKSIYDAEDSFPTGALRKSGRVFMRPDLVALSQLDGVLYNVKFLIIVRNTTDTALSALRRNFFSNIDAELRTVEHTLTYIEAALRGVPCERIMIAHYEHVLADPGAYRAPLTQFLELGNAEKEVLNSRLSKKGRLPPRKAHKLTQYEECKFRQLDEITCYNLVLDLVETFFKEREFMWPSFAGNGYDYVAP